MSNNLQRNPPSIHTLPVNTTGGTPARIGFNLQDHVAARLCIQMLSDETIKEVWCEAHDDITLMWQGPASEEVEFIQVKGEEPDQLWSIALLCAPDGNSKKKQGTSILERSLAHHRCSEPCKFRIVTSRDVKDELRPLLHPLNSSGRAAVQKELVELAQKCACKVNGFQSEQGGDCSFWIDRTVWEVVHGARAIEDKNRNDLQAEMERRSVLLLTDQNAELYGKLVRLTYDAALSVTAEQKKLKRLRIIEWVNDTAHALSMPGPKGGERLAAKMADAGLPQDAVESARRLRMDFRRELLTQRYAAPEDYSRVEGEVLARLNALRARLDCGRILDNGLSFHTRCLEELETLSTKSLASSLGSAFRQGCMYDITDRCIHRFVRVSA
jgi:hypothetical protein